MTAARAKVVLQLRVCAGAEPIPDWFGGDLFRLAARRNYPGALAIVAAALTMREEWERLTLAGGLPEAMVPALVEFDTKLREWMEA